MYIMNSKIYRHRYVSLTELQNFDIPDIKSFTVGIKQTKSYASSHKIWNLF